MVFSPSLMPHPTFASKQLKLDPRSSWRQGIAPTRATKSAGLQWEIFYYFFSYFNVLSFDLNCKKIVWNLAIGWVSNKITLVQVLQYIFKTRKFWSLEHYNSVQIFWNLWFSCFGICCFVPEVLKKVKSFFMKLWSIAYHTCMSCFFQPLRLYWDNNGLSVTHSLRTAAGPLGSTCADQVQKLFLASYTL